MDFAILVNHKVKMEEDKKDKYVYLTRKLKSCGT